MTLTLVIHHGHSTWTCSDIFSLNDYDKEPGVAYRYYVENAATMPEIVGTHWFQWADQPSTGHSFDGENFNIGLVDTTDRPYPELIEAMQATHRRLSTILDSCWRTNSSYTKTRSALTIRSS